MSEGGAVAGARSGTDVSERVIRRAPIATARAPPWLRAPRRVTAAEESLSTRGILPGRPARRPRYGPLRPGRRGVRDRPERQACTAAAGHASPPGEGCQAD